MHRIHQSTHDVETRDTIDNYELHVDTNDSIIPLESVNATQFRVNYLLLSSIVMSS